MPKKKDSICSQILTPKQFGPICWFMALFVAIFYSQCNRKILLKASKNWVQDNELFKTLYDVLHNKYLKKSANGEDYDYFSDDTFIKILSLLFQENKKIFPFNPKHKKMLKAFSPQLYIGKLYTLLGIDYKMFDYNKGRNILRYSCFNKEYDNLLILKIENENYSKYEINDKKGILIGHKYIEDDYAPPILIIMVHDDFEYPIYESILPNNVIPETSKNSKIRYRQNNITYNEQNYTLDSVVLFNSNTEDNNGHIIAGITCEDKRYIYNGWIKKSIDTSKGITRDIPCQLMPYNWNIMFDNNFSLNTQNCLPDILETEVEKGEFSFNFSEGIRILIYVKDEAESKTSKYIESYIKDDDDDILEIPKESSPSLLRNDKYKKNPISPPNWVELSKNLHAVEFSSVESKGGKNIQNKILTKSPKNCPKGKVLNPKTGRYILIKNALNKNEVNTKSPKKCPEGKVLNPKTGRFINKKPLIAIKPYNKKGGRICSKILTPKQVGETCWFMSIFVAMFYSQRSRKILLRASRKWNLKKDLFKKLNDILHDKYLKTSKGNDYSDYNGDIFIEILSLLYEENEIIFPYNPKEFSYGFWAEVYIGRLYKLLNVDYKMFDYQPHFNRVAYSAFNEGLDIFRYDIFNKNLKRRVGIAVEKGYKYVEDKKAPPILIIRLYDFDNFDMYYKGNMLESHVLPDGDAKDELKSTREQITYNEKMYKLDSTILMSFNGHDYGESHYITGITCKNKKYIYNGWLRTQMDPRTVDKNKTIKIPCELMRYEWDVDNKYFCIDTKNCSPKILDYNTELKKTMPIDFCFNFKYGQRLLIYVREDATSENSKETSSPVSK